MATAVEQQPQTTLPAPFPALFAQGFSRGGGSKPYSGTRLIFSGGVRKNTEVSVTPQLRRRATSVRLETLRWNDLPLAAPLYHLLTLTRAYPGK
jgi:hypothetical protein